MITINEIIANPELLNADNCWGFYDWFCVESSLKRIAKGFIPKLKFLVKHGFVDGNKTSVWFKNNCPMVGTLYTDMRFTTIENDKFVGGICPKTGHENVKNKCEVWTLGKDNELISYNFANWSTFKKEVKENEQLDNFQKIKSIFNG